MQQAAMIDGRFCALLSTEHGYTPSSHAGAVGYWRHASGEFVDAVQRMRQGGMPLQGHAAREARPVLPGELRAHEAPDGALD